MTRKRKLDKARALCAKYGVLMAPAVHYNHGYSMPWAGWVFIPEGQGSKQFFITLCHEIAHCLNFRNKKYLQYHSRKPSKGYLRKMSLRAEVYTERVGARIYKECGFKGRYVAIYKFTDQWREFLKRHFKY